jgi:hypothetical protein
MWKNEEYKKRLSSSIKTKFKPGSIPWNKGLRKETEPRLKVMAEKIRANNPFKRPEVRAKISEAMKGRRAWNKERYKVAVSKELLHKLHWIENRTVPEIAKVLGVSLHPAYKYFKRFGVPIRTKGENMKIVWKRQEHRDKTVKNTLKSLMRRPTNPERSLISIIKRYHFPFRYVGNGEVLIDGKSPDFISTDKSNKVIEVFGVVFHDPNRAFMRVPYDQTVEGRIAHYKKNGFDCLILWDYEIKHVQEVCSKIRGFLNGKSTCMYSNS